MVVAAWLLGEAEAVETRSKSLEVWCRLQDSNPWPPDYKSGALPTELSRHASRRGFMREWASSSRSAAVPSLRSGGCQRRRPKDNALTAQAAKISLAPSS